MDGEAGERANHQSRAVVIAGYIAGLNRVLALARPGIVIAALICLAVLLEARRLAAMPLPSLAIGFISFPLTVTPLRRAIFELSALCGLMLIVLCWWLPRGHLAALFVPLSLVASALPLISAEPLITVCAYAISVAALVPLLARGEDDGGAALLLGVTALGTACLVIGLAAVRSASNPEVSNQLPLARAAMMAGFALLLGVAPAPFWLPGVSKDGHPAGATLAAGLMPVLAMLLAFDVLNAPNLRIGGLLSGLEGQAIVPFGLLTVLLATGLALFQHDAHRVAGFLLVADLGYMVAGLGNSLHNGNTDQVFAAVLHQLGGRGLAALVLLPSLALLDGGLGHKWRRSLIVLVACGGWMALGGPLTAAFPARWADLQPILNGEQPVAALLRAAVILSALAYMTLLTRTLAVPCAASERPASWLAVAIAAALVVLSFVLSQDPAWFERQTLGVVTWLVGR